IILPKNISNVTEYGIGYCPNLKNVYVDNGNMLFYSEDGVLFNKNKTELIKYPSAKENTTYTILDTVTSINSYAFSYASHLESVTIPSSVVSIGDSAFMQSGLTTLSISSGAIKIFNSAFEQCEQLENVTIQSSVTFFGDGVFAYCNNLKSITLSDTDSELSLDNKGVLFNKDKTKLICYPAGKDTVDTTYDIPDSVTEIAPCAFSCCFKLNKVTINSDISTIGDFAFFECYYEDNTTDKPFTLIMNDTTPPELGQNIFTYINNVSIQVPSGSVETYKTEWSDYADKIGTQSNP
ncbi:MAG: leucine-rich repeat domain-containing protein, partial [Spirochaetales bacterium]|nr:leucine-rich repeat domain-containing protein [Spirochaetales bacterium]